MGKKFSILKNYYSMRIVERAFIKLHLRLVLLFDTKKFLSKQCVYMLYQQKKSIKYLKKLLFS